MPGNPDQQPWSGLHPIERDEVLADLLVQAADQEGRTPADLLQQLTAPVSRASPAASTGVSASFTSSLAGESVLLHQRVTAAVAALKQQARQAARARRRRAIVRVAAPLVRAGAVALAGLLVVLAVSAQREAGRAALDAASARGQLAAAEKALQLAGTRRSALDAEVSQIAPLAAPLPPPSTNLPAVGQSPDPATQTNAGAGLARVSTAPPSAGDHTPGQARERLLLLQRHAEQRAKERDQLRGRWAELEPRLIEAMAKRLAELREALAGSRKTWQALETEAKAMLQPSPGQSDTASQPGQVLQTIASWQTRLSERDRLLAQFKVTPANLGEADRLIQASVEFLTGEGVQARQVRGSLANRAMPAEMRAAFTIPSDASDAFGNPVVKRQGQGTDPASGLPLELVHQASGLVLVLVPAGEFQMGSPDGEAGRSQDEGPVHGVRFAQPFYLGKYAVTQDQWQKVMGNNPSQFKGDGRRPVEMVSWEDAQGLVGKLNQSLAGVAGVRFGLPSEAQREYACRAGSVGRYGFGDDDSRLGEYAWYSDNSGGSTHPVGQKKPNGWALYDLHGNVWEWCEDVWHESYRGAPGDGRAWTEGGSQNARVLRGGSWNYVSRGFRAAYRFRYRPGYRYDFRGVRVVLGVGARTP